MLGSDGDVNSSQDTPSHDSKEKADLPDGKPSKLSFGSGKVVKGPEQQKINKNIFMTRGSDSTIKQAFVGGFFSELSKQGFAFPQPATEKVTTHGKANPSERSGFMRVQKTPHLSVAKRSSAAGFSALPKPKGPNPLLAAMGKK